MLGFFVWIQITCQTKFWESIKAATRVTPGKKCWMHQAVCQCIMFAICFLNANHSYFKRFVCCNIHLNRLIELIPMNDHNIGLNGNVAKMFTVCNISLHVSVTLVKSLEWQWQ